MAEEKSEELETKEPVVTDPVETEQTDEAVEKKPKNLKELIAYIKAHENLRQVVLFTLFSLICGATQMLITLLLPIILKAASPDKMNEAFGWIKMGKGYFFDFTDEGQGLGSFLGWLIGSIWGQTLTFILNRKKTFNAPDHVVFRAVAYTIMAILIIIAQTAIGKLEGVLKAHDPDASDFVNVVYNLIAQVVAGLAAFTMSFFGNKFMVLDSLAVPCVSTIADTEGTSSLKGTLWTYVSSGYPGFILFSSATEFVRVLVSSNIVYSVLRGEYKLKGNSLEFKTDSEELNRTCTVSDGRFTYLDKTYSLVSSF